MASANLKSVRRIANRLRNSGDRLTELAAAIDNWADVMEVADGKTQTAAERADEWMVGARDRAIRAIRLISEAIGQLQVATEELKKAER